MINYLLRRIVVALPVALGIIALVFLIVRVTPGDPAILLAGPDAPQEVVEQIRERYGLNRSLAHQFTGYLSQVMRGDLGTSVRSGEPVVRHVMRALPHTLELVVVAELLSLLIAIPLGVISALHRGAFLDKALMTLAVIGVSVPIFFVGLILLLVFGYYLPWFPLGGRGGPLWTLEGWHFILLPGITLAAFHIASLARVTRSGMLEVLGQDYVRTARAKGLENRRITFGHALRNALLPVLTIVGVQTAQFIGGTVVTETIFSWPGMGREVVRSIFTQDYALIQGFLLVIGLMIIGINIVVDLLYGAADPRIRYT